MAESNRRPVQPPLRSEGGWHGSRHEPAVAQLFSLGHLSCEQAPHSRDCRFSAGSVVEAIRLRAVARHSATQRRRRDIFVETRPKQILSSVRSGIFGKSILAEFENISRVVIHAKILQQSDIFFAE